jgi:DNA invertase Pin-like site-specific DNA recombinase
MGMSKPAAAKFVSYARVSTDEQGKDGLGIDAQSHAMRQYVESVGGEMLREFVEVASGNDDDRPKLAEALKLAKRTGAILLVAKLDRLSRVVAKIAGLLRQGAELRVVECANASTLELQIRAVIAEEERRKIGERTRDALAAAKRRGTKLGSARPGHWAGREDRRKLGQQRATEAAAAARRELRSETYAAALPMAQRLAAEGASLRTIAAELNAEGITTPRGASWQAAQVQRLLRAES